jgi:hypothetical protein
MSIIKIAGLSLLIIIFISSLISYGYQTNQAVITVNNPYRLIVHLEIKCDWSNKINDFIYKRNIVVKGNSSNKIYIRNDLKDCQVWPKVRWF